MPPRNQLFPEKIVTPGKPENIKMQSFDVITQGIILGFNEKRLTFSDFNFGGKNYSITSPGLAVGAIGGAALAAAQKSYDEIITPRDFHV